MNTFLSTKGGIVSPKLSDELKSEVNMGRMSSIMESIIRHNVDIVAFVEANITLFQLFLHHLSV
jgi:hypothetical protein